MVGIPGEFLTAYMDNEFIMVLWGSLEELMVDNDPIIYRKFVAIDTGWMVLYFKLQKTLYGCLISMLLFYDNLVSYLKSKVFIINPYDPCVSNMIINWNQMTTTWHIDKPKILHVDKQ